MDGKTCMISYDIEIGCPHRGKLVVELVLCMFSNRLLAQTGLDWRCVTTPNIQISVGGPNSRSSHY